MAYLVRDLSKDIQCIIAAAGRTNCEGGRQIRELSWSRKWVRGMKEKLSHAATFWGKRCSASNTDRSFDRLHPLEGREEVHRR
jgi:hypothetical protein